MWSRQKERGTAPPLHLIMEQQEQGRTQLGARPVRTAKSVIDAVKQLAEKLSQNEARPFHRLHSAEPVSARVMHTCAFSST